MNAHAHATPAQPETQDQYSRTIEAVARNPAPQNEDSYQQPSLFRSLERQRLELDYLGRNWKQPILLDHSARLATLRNQLRGVCGLTVLLKADFDARQDAAPEEQFTETLREALFLALVELANAADTNMGAIGDAGMDEQLRAERGGVAA